MLELHDPRQSSFYQWAAHEGEAKTKLAMIPRLAQAGLSAEQIAHILQLDLDLIRQTMTPSPR